MSELGGDEARVTVLVRVEPELAFRVFTEEIDAWWRRGLPYRVGGGDGTLVLEPKLGGRLYESVGDRLIESGRVTLWEPPRRLILEWRALNFAPRESTEVEVVFEPSASGTLVTLTHRGWNRIRADHPARHGQDVGAFLRGLGLWWGDLLRALGLHAGGRP
jgi:uncharacterized protein YndB with AHSA1/START domain